VWTMRENTYNPNCSCIADVHIAASQHGLSRVRGRKDDERMRTVYDHACTDVQPYAIDFVWRREEGSTDGRAAYTHEEQNMFASVPLYY